MQGAQRLQGPQHRNLLQRSLRIKYDNIPDLIDLIIKQQRYRERGDKTQIIGQLDYQLCIYDDNYRYRYLLLLAAWGSQNMEAMIGLMYSIFDGKWRDAAGETYCRLQDLGQIRVPLGGYNNDIDVFDLSVYQKLCDDRFGQRTNLCTQHASAAFTGVMNPPHDLNMFDNRFTNVTAEELHNREMEEINPTPMNNQYIYPILELCKGTNPYESIVFQQYIKLGLCKDNIYAGLFLSFWCKNKLGIVWFLNELNDPTELQVVLNLIKSLPMLLDIINVRIAPLEDEWLDAAMGGNKGNDGGGDGGISTISKTIHQKSSKKTTTKY